METYSLVQLAHQRSRRLSRIFTIAAYALLLILIPFAVAFLSKNGTSQRVIGWSVAGVFVLMALPLTIHDINMHLSNFDFPELQKYIVRILFMVPVYAVTSWLSLGYEDLYPVLETFRSMYEAFVIWSFMYFLMLYLGPTEEVLVARLEQKAQQHHLFPLNYIWTPWKMGAEFLFKCKSGTLQYVVWKIFNVFLVAISSAMGTYKDGVWRLDSVYFYSVLITNFSQVVAIYCLVLFYHVTSSDLAAIKPLAKFICIKAVVFFSFWQGSAISMLVYFGIIKDTPFFSAKVYAKGLQDFLICVEMFFFAVAHHYVFSYRDFETYRHSSGHSSFTTDRTNVSSNDWRRALLESANPRDLLHDIRQDIGSRLSSVGSFRGSIIDDGEGEGGKAEGFESAANFQLSERFLVDVDSFDESNLSDDGGSLRFESETENDSPKQNVT